MPVSAKKRREQKNEVEVPNVLKPYIQHGLDLNYQNGAREIVCECPFCTKEKFSINAKEGVWQCFTCSAGGSVYDFLERLVDESDTATKPSDYIAFAHERGLEFPETLMEWSACRSILTGQWMIPVLGTDYKGNLKLRQVYFYVKTKDRYLLMPTVGLDHCLFGLHNYDKKKDRIYLCEGPWDAMRLEEALKTTKLVEDGSIRTTGSSENLLKDINVLAAPTCSSFNPSWGKWFKGKSVAILFDNDYPKKTPNGERPPAGFEGMKRVVRRLGDRPSEITYLKWGPDGYDPDLADGYDIKEALNENKVEGLTNLIGRITEVPEEWRTVNAETGEELVCRECKDWKTLVNSWRKALKWTDGLDHALATMMACIASTKSIGDQLWIKVISPPSGGKSTLCEALSVNKKYIKAKSTIRGFHSGYKSDKEGTIDNSLAATLNGMTLVTKDGDTLLQSPNLGQILSEARDLFDGSSRTHYRNRMSKDYEGQRMTWILCGTSSLREIDSSELGQRFLDCVIMDKIDLGLEDDILWRMVNQAATHVDIESDGEFTSQHSPEMAQAMELTGGYISHLRENASKLLPKIEFSDEAKKRCIHIGKFVAYMRARPSKKHSEKAERELAARLVSQHARLAKCLALVLNRTHVNEQVMKRVYRVGLDTARGNVLDICMALYNTPSGLVHQAVKMYVSCGDQELGKLMRFLREIGVVQKVKEKTRNNVWRMTDHLRELFGYIIENAEE